MPGFSPRFFLRSSNMATGCDRRSLDPHSAFPWVYATGSCTTPVVVVNNTSGSHVTTTKKKARGKPGHAQNLLPVSNTSGQGLFRSRDFVTFGQKAPLRTTVELACSGGVSRSCYTSDTCRVTVK
jgi:hypothetical protein